MKLDELKDAVAAGTIDTVVLAMTDMQGRLQGKRLTATHFLGEVLENGAESCNYLLAVDVEMNTVGGYAMSPGSAATATWCSCPTSTRCAPCRGRRGRRCASRTSHGSTGPTCSPRPARCCDASWLVSPSAAGAPTPAPSSSSWSSSTPMRRHGTRASASCVRRTSTTSTTRCSARPVSSR